MKTKIQWADYTFNPWRGCVKIAPGCTYCYAETNRAVLAHGTKWGSEKQGGTRTLAARSTWNDPVRWNSASVCGQNGCRRRMIDGAPCKLCRQTPPPKVFAASLADVMEDWDGPMVNHHGQTLYLDDRGAARTDPVAGRFYRMTDARNEFFRLVDRCQNLVWLLLTKRPFNVGRFWPQVHAVADYGGRRREWTGTEGLGRQNVWLGASCSDQATAGTAWQQLQHWAHLSPVLWLSYEPALGPVDWEQVWGNGWLPAWIVVGGESGPAARPFNVEWGLQTVRQCAAAGVPVFFKQVGSNAVRPPDSWDRSRGFVQGDYLEFTTEHPKGGEPDEWPSELRVRDFPVGYANG